MFIFTKNYNMKNMKTWLMVIAGLLIYLNMDKLKGLIGKKEDESTPTN